MRTPAETLEKLAQVAPKEWGVTWYEDEGTLGVRELLCSYRPCLSDIENSYLTAWCKKQLGGRGWRIAIDWQTRCDVVAMHADDPDTYVASLCPTEWQAVAECLIQVLEKGNEQ